MGRRALEDPKLRRRLLATVAFTLFLDLAGFGIILPILPLYADKLGASAVAVTLLSTTFSLAQFVMAPVLGSLSDRYGRRPVMLISIAGSIGANVVLGFSMSLWLVFTARLVAGASKSNVSTAFAYVSDIIEPQDRAKYMGIMGAALGLGFVVGPGIGGTLASATNPTLPFFVSAALSLVNLIMAWWWLPETRWAREDQETKAADELAAAAEAPSEDEDDEDASILEAAMDRRPGLREVWKRIAGTPMVPILVVYFVFFSGFAAMESTFALYNKAIYGWLEKETGFFLTYVGVVMVVVQGGLIGRLVSRFGESKTMVVGIAINVVGFLCLGGAPFLSAALDLPLTTADGGMTVFTGAMLAVSGLGIAGGNGIVNATMAAIVSQVSSKDEQGFNMGIRESAGSFARIMGPIVAGPVFEYIHPAAPLLLAAALGTGNLFIALRLGRRLRERGLR